MKHKIRLFITTMLISILTTTSAFAYDVCIDGIYYDLVSKSKSATVVRKNSNYKYSGNIVIPGSITHEGVDYSVTSIGNSAFEYSSITSITIPNSIASIGDSAFSSCTKLFSVSITDIAAWCEIQFSSNFSNPLYLAGTLFLNGKLVNDLVLPDSVTRISPFAFFGCTSLTSITIPNSVTEIGWRAFENCSSFKAVHITDLAAWCKIECSSIYGSSVLSGRYLYLNGELVKDMVIPSSVTRIEGNTFRGCSSLTSVTIPNYVTYIGGYAFYGCSSLTSVNIGNAVKYIKNFTFGNCQKLTDVTIGKSVDGIGEKAFVLCKELTNVYCHAVTPPRLSSDAFNESQIEFSTLYVPAESIAKYKAADIWKDFGTIKALEGGDIEEKQCATPTISYSNGELRFDCETAGATCYYSLTDTDIKTAKTLATNNKVGLTACYNIECYAIAGGHTQSNTATAKLYWLKSAGTIDSPTNINSAQTRGIVVQTLDGIVTLSGLDEGETVRFSTIDGRSMGSVRAYDGQASIAAQSGTVVIANIGTESVKIAVK